MRRAMALASQNLTVIGTGLEIVIDEIPEEDYADSRLTVIGTSTATRMLSG